MNIHDKTLFIINPKSGTRSHRGLKESIRALFGHAADIVYTRHPGHATDLARHAALKGYAKVVAIGGDGTINEAATGLLDTTTALGIVPFGSGNGLARHLHIPMKRDEALKIARDGVAVRCDCGEVNVLDEDGTERLRPFFCTMGVGFDARVSHEFAECKRRGLLTYSRIAIEHFLRYQPEDYQIEVDGRECDYRAFLVAVCNASQYGNNAFIAPRASMSDGLLDVTIMQRGSLPRLAEAGVRLFNHTLDRSPLIHAMTGHTVTIHRDAPGPGHLDGEPLTLPATIRIACRPARLSIICTDS